MRIMEEKLEHCNIFISQKRNLQSSGRHGVYFVPKEANAMLDVIAENDTQSLELWPWTGMSSDDAMSRFCFSGIAAHHTRRVDADGNLYVTDFSWLEGLEVRTSLESVITNTYTPTHCRYEPDLSDTVLPHISMKMLSL